MNRAGLFATHAEILVLEPTCRVAIATAALSGDLWGNIP